MARAPLYSIGHGSRSAEDFLSLLQRRGIDCLIDVRAYPRSRRHPQFSRVLLEPTLAGAGIRYLWEGAALGGMRRPGRDSPHSGLIDAAFRGYADHMATKEFARGLDRLVDLGAACRVAFMCAEVLPCHCHRSFIADALAAGGTQVWHLVSAQDIRLHAMHPSAREHGGALVYDLSRQLALGF